MNTYLGRRRFSSLCDRLPLQIALPFSLALRQFKKEPQCRAEVLRVLRRLNLILQQSPSRLPLVIDSSSLSMKWAHLLRQSMESPLSTLSSDRAHAALLKWHVITRSSLDGSTVSSKNTFP